MNVTFAHTHLEHQVDAYETEVGILEKTLKQLQAHEWGSQDEPTALLESLGMDRGQQVLDTAERKQASHDLLQQQLQMVDMLEGIMAEQYALYQAASSANGMEDLKAELQLSEEQCRELQESAAGWEEEWSALQTLKSSLEALKENDWLWNDDVTSVAEQFMAILHKNQISKFLLWTDHNSEAIDELDGVHAPPTIPGGPIFSFGVDSHPEGAMGDDKD